MSTTKDTRIISPALLKVDKLIYFAISTMNDNLTLYFMIFIFVLLSVTEQTSISGSRPVSWEPLMWKIMPDAIKWPSILHSFICECSLSLCCIRCLFISYNREHHWGLTIPIIIQITEPKEAKRPNEEWISSHLESERMKRPQCSKLEVTLVMTWVPTLQDIEIMIPNRDLHLFFFELATADYVLKCLNVGFEVDDSMASSYLQSSCPWENIENT